jgi:hypothetical protein
MDEETKLGPLSTRSASAQKRQRGTFVNELAERISTMIQLTTDGFIFYDRHVEELREYLRTSGRIA